MSPTEAKRCLVVISAIFLLMSLCPTVSGGSDVPVCAETAGTSDTDIEPTSGHGDSPDPPERRWQRAINQDDVLLLRQLLPCVDTAVANEKGKNALMSAAKAGDLGFFRDLQNTGLSAASRSHTGGTVLMYAVLGNKLETIRHLLSGSVVSAQTAQLMLNAQSTNGWTAAMIAAAKGFDRALELLVSHGADPWLADAYQWTPIMRAIDNRHAAVVRYLVTLPDALIDERNENGSTALHVAVQTRDVATVQLLIEAGANTRLRDNHNRLPLDIALQIGVTDAVGLLSGADEPTGN